MRFNSDDQRRAVFAKIGGYHGSQFGPKDKLESGFHIGSKKAAEERLVAHNVGNRSGRVSEYKIDKYEGDYSKPYLKDDRMLTEYDPDDNTSLFRINNLESEKNALLKEGYDYIPYINAVEDKGSISYMILDPSKLKRVEFSEISPEIQGTFLNPWGEDIATLEERPVKELRYMRGIYGVHKGHKYIDTDSKEFRDFKAHKRGELGDDVFYMTPDEDIFNEYVKSKSNEMSSYDGLTVLPPKIRYNEKKGYGYYAEIPFRHKPKQLKEEIDKIMQPFNVGSMSGDFRVEPEEDTQEGWQKASNKYVDTMAEEIKQKKGTVPVVGITHRDIKKGTIGEGRHRILAAERAGLETIPVAIEVGGEE
jgi:hypothetical protein